MVRPLRLEFSGALYHVTARGNARQGIYLDDQDRHLFLSVLAEVVGRFAWICHAHRPFTVVDAHEILVMEDSRIAERGTHAELLEMNQKYAKMWNLQQSSE